jgi:hypothetical protein
MARARPGRGPSRQAQRRPGRSRGPGTRSAAPAEPTPVSVRNCSRAMLRIDRRVVVAVWGRRTGERPLRLAPYLPACASGHGSRRPGWPRRGAVPVDRRTTRIPSIENLRRGTPGLSPEEGPRAAGPERRQATGCAGTPRQWGRAVLDKQSPVWHREMAPYHERCVRGAPRGRPVGKTCPVCWGASAL